MSLYIIAVNPSGKNVTAAIPCICEEKIEKLIPSKADLKIEEGYTSVNMPPVSYGIWKI